MIDFLLAIGCFLVAHLVPPIPAVRCRLIAVCGRRAYIFGYSSLSLALLVWIVVAARQAPFIPLWDPAPWQAAVSIAAMPLALWFLLIGFSESNLLSISFRRRNPAIPPSSMVAITRHPVLWGFLIWAASHIAPNGDVVSLVLFGGITALAAVSMPILDFRARRRLGYEQWQKIASPTSVLPFAAIISGRAKVAVTWKFLLLTGAAIIVYLWFLFFGHQLLIGINPLVWIGR